jgi:hypothetical protein
MYRKFDVTENLLFAQYFFKEVNTALIATVRAACEEGIPLMKIETQRFQSRKRAVII